MRSRVLNNLVISLMNLIRVVVRVMLLRLGLLSVVMKEGGRCGINLREILIKQDGIKGEIKMRKVQRSHRMSSWRTLQIAILTIIKPMMNNCHGTTLMVTRLAVHSSITEIPQVSHPQLLKTTSPPEKYRLVA